MQIFDQRMGQPVRPVGQFFIGALPSIADQRHGITKAAIHHGIGQFDTCVQPFTIIKAASQQVWPVGCGGQIVAREAVRMCRYIHRKGPLAAAAGPRCQPSRSIGKMAVASISRRASSSTSALTTTIVIAGK